MGVDIVSYPAERQHRGVVTITVDSSPLTTCLISKLPEVCRELEARYNAEPEHQKPLIVAYWHPEDFQAHFRRPSANSLASRPIH